MNEDNIERAVKISTAVYGELIRAYPKAFREQYGPEMAQVFHEQCRDAATGANGFGLLKLWLRALLDLVKSCPREHVAAWGGNMNMFKQALLGRLWLAPLLAFLVVASGVALVFSLKASKLYQSTTRLGFLGTIQVPLDFNDSVDFFQAFTALVRSRPVLSQVVVNLSLNQRLAAHFNAREPWTIEQTYQWLRKKTDAWLIRHTTLFTVAVTDVSANQAAEIANEIARVIVQHDPQKLTRNLFIIEPATTGPRDNRPAVLFASIGYGLAAATLSFLFVVATRRFRTLPTPA